MPVSGNEENGVKPIARQSSDYGAGVPIKKRKFPLYRSPSPPREESTSLQVENDSLQKEYSGLSLGSTLSNASVTTSSTGLSDTNKNTLSEEKKGSSDATNINVVQSNAKHSRVKLEEPHLKVCSGSLIGMDSKEKLVEAGKSACQTILEKIELQLAPAEDLGLSMGKEIYSKQNVEGNCKSEIPTVARNIELSLGPKEPLVPVLARQNSKGSCQSQERLDSVSLNLSLSKGLCKSNDVESMIGGTDLRTNRSNWDLNTTMDAWEGSTKDAATGQVHGDESIATGATLDIKPVICSTGMVGSSVASGKQVIKERERRSNFSTSPSPSGQQHTSEDSLHLGLSPCSLQSNLSQEPSYGIDSGGVIPNMASVLVSPGNLSMINYRTVKSEPFDESAKQVLKGAKHNLMGLLDYIAVKREVVERYSPEALKSFSSTLKLVDSRSIKSESIDEGNFETPKTVEGASHQSDKQVIQNLDNSSCTTAMPITAQLPCATGKSTCSTDLSISGDVSSHPVHSIYTKGAHINEEAHQEACESTGHVSSETISISKGHDGEESNVPGMIDAAVDENKNVGDHEQCRLKFMDELAPEPRGNGEGSVSDEEKINISGDMLEEDSYGSDYDSDDNHALDETMDAEQDGGEDDYEDGEVREPQVQIATEDHICEKKVQLVNHVDSDNKKMEFVRFPIDDHPTSSHVEEKDTILEDPAETKNNNSNECVDKVLEEKSNKGADKDTRLQESLAVEVPTSGADIKRPVKATRRKPLDQSGRKDAPKGQETELSSDQATNKSQETVVTVAQGADENVNKTNLVGNNDSALPKVETSLNCDDAFKDANSGGNRSRIINLSRASNVSSPGKTRSISGRSLPSRAGRERLPDVALEGDKLLPRGRDEIHIDGSHKFSRERLHDQSPRNYRSNITRGRGRIIGRLDTRRVDWDSNRGCAPELYNGAPEIRVPRQKYASVADADLEFNSYNMAPDGAYVGTGRGGRKPLNDEALIFCQPASRRRSPGGRDEPAARGLHMLRRIPRNISPSRCIGEDGSELVGLRHSEKFMRGFPDDAIDSIFTHPQPPYDGVDGHFVRGNRNFPSSQRRGFPRIRSKSPIRSRTRSPGTWSPRRRSPDGFGGHPELPHRRSPAICRMERIRSPDRPCFHGSPSYMSRPSNDLRAMESGQDHGHPRSVILNRSPPGRVIHRNRRFDMVGPRERPDNDQYFGEPLHSGRFPELGSDGNGDERRRFGERRGPVRSFRPPFNGADGENFHLNAEDGARPYRFCPEDDSGFHERGNLREREFDRRFKNRSGNARRRTRSIEEEEGNYRHGGQVWRDDGFDDVSGGKRKRF